MRVFGEAADRQVGLGSEDALRVLARHPGTPVTLCPEAAAALLDGPVPDAVRMLNELVAARLAFLVPAVGDGPARYSIPEQVLDDARARDGEDTSQDQRDQSVRRLAEWYLRGAVHADRAVNAYRKRFGPLYKETRTGEPSAGEPSADALPADPWSGVAAGLDWLESERRNLRTVVEFAGVRGWHDIAWQLCEALYGLYVTRRHYDDWVATHTVGLAAATTLGDARAEYQMAAQLGYAFTEQGDLARAQPILEQALRAGRATRLHVHEAAALEALGGARLAARQFPQAITYFTQARALYTVIDSAHGMARTSYEMGRVQVWLGEYNGAIEHFRGAHALFGQVRDTTDQARVLISTGEALLLLGDAAEARRPLAQARKIMARQGRRFHEAVALDLLAAAAERCGDLKAARTFLSEAIAGYARTGSTRAEDLRTRLAELPAPNAEPVPTPEPAAAQVGPPQAGPRQAGTAQPGPVPAASPEPQPQP